MKIKQNKQIAIFLILTTAWYLITFVVPYNLLADSLGHVNLGNGHSWPLSFFLMDALVIGLVVAFIYMAIQDLKKKTVKIYWVLLTLLLVYPLITVWATLQDLVFSPIAP